MSVIQPFTECPLAEQYSADINRRAREWYQQLMARVAMIDHQQDKAIEAILCARQLARVKPLGKARPDWILPAPVPTLEPSKSLYFMRKDFPTAKKGRPRKQPAAIVEAA
jgi:hypothetical protein